MGDNVRAGVVLAGSGLLIFVGWWSGLFGELIDVATGKVRSPSGLPAAGATGSGGGATPLLSEPVPPVQPRSA